VSLYDEIVPVMDKQLVAMDKWLDKAAEYAKQKNFDSSVLVNARLAPDQFPFSRQVQVACDQTKFAAARVSGKEPPKNPDTEQSLDELKARIATARAYLATFKRSDFDGAEERVVPLFFLPGKGMKARDFLREHVLPNFYFHATTAYAILRHNGVELGKRDFVGSITTLDL
jgi:hypothetical protein